MTKEELLVVIDALDLDYNLDDHKDQEWLERTLNYVNRGLKQLKKKK